MRLLIAVSAITLLASAALAAPPPTAGSGTMMGTGPMMGSQTMMSSHPMMGPAKMMGAGTMIIHHQVADYAKWRVAYDADQTNRTKAGLTNCRVQRSMDNANDVMISCNMADITRARAFTSSKALMDTMSAAGVVGKPQFLFLSPPQ